MALHGLDNGASKLMWLDMEMTGLDVQKEVPIEIGVVVTDMRLSTCETYHAVLKQDQRFLESMDDWNKKHHGESGLVDAVSRGRAPQQVEVDLLELCDQHFAKERVILAGNSIGQDRLFIEKHFLNFAKRLHYRMLDVTSFKLVFWHMHSCAYDKKISTHRALEDILESIEELKFYLQFLDKNKIKEVMQKPKA